MGAIREHVGGGVVRCHGVGVGAQGPRGARLQVRGDARGPRERDQERRVERSGLVVGHLLARQDRLDLGT